MIDTVKIQTANFKAVNL